MFELAIIATQNNKNLTGLNLNFHHSGAVHYTYIIISIQVTLGGMVYDEELNRGIHKKYLPEPNPQKVELPRNASLIDVFEKAKHLFFDESDNIENMCLADSGGVEIPVDDRKDWSLSSFYERNRLQPSRYKLYVAKFFGEFFWGSVAKRRNM